MFNKEASRCSIGGRPTARCPCGNQRRIIDDALDELFPHLAAVALEGAKGVGNTATASERARSILSLNLSAQQEIVAADSDFVVRVERPVLVDEWQLLPSVWDRVRKTVVASQRDD
ncbi:hypothetical protein [Xylanimonas sp. McL0601]|uniref:hypothetical protein n=1 Tax=Xylanimonas sp. McL0601 TaxID=3414739 RepID=UPI003CED1532